MQVNNNMVPDLLVAISQAQQAQNTDLEQMSTGKRVNQPSDDPVAAGAEVLNQTESAQADQYSQNVNSLLETMQTADSALSAVVTQLNQAVSLGTQGGDGTLNSSNLQALAQQVQGILQSVVQQANTSYEGVYLFGGTDNSQVPFTASGSGYQYNGNIGPNAVNNVTIGNGLTVAVNVPGNQIFQQPGSDVLGSLQQLVTALQSGSSSSIATATTQVSSALTYFDQQRTFYGDTINQLNSQESFLQQETVNLTSQEDNLVGANLAQVATDYAQAQTTYNAALAATSRAVPSNLLDYLQ